MGWSWIVLALEVAKEQNYNDDCAHYCKYPDNGDLHRWFSHGTLKTAQYWGYICDGISFNKLVLPEKAITRPSTFFTADQVRAILAKSQGGHRVMLRLLP